MSDEQIAAAAEFAGPPELKTHWERFVAAYSKTGVPHLKLQFASLLSRVAFEPGGAAKITSFYSDDPAGFHQLKRDIEDAARALGDATSDAEFRPLHRDVVSALITQWIELEKTFGLYPPTSLHGATTRDRQETHKRRSAMLHTQDGQLLAGVLKLLESRIVGATAAPVWKRCQETLPLDEVVAIANDLFDRALFTYQAGRDVHFNTWIVGTLRNFLPHDVQKLIKARRKPNDTAAMDTVVDDRHGTPLDDAGAVEERTNLRLALKSLPKIERTVLSLRFGLNKGGVTHTLKQVGEKLGISHETARQIEMNAREHCRELLAAGTSSPSDYSGRHDSPGRRR